MDGRIGWLVSQSKKSMWRFRYNALAILNVGIGFVNSLLTMTAFGVSKEADALFVAQTIYSTLALLSLSLVEQFLYYYHRIKGESEDEAKGFFNAVFSWATIINAAFVICLFVLLDQVARLFALRIDGERFLLIRGVLPFYLVSLVFAPMSVLVNSLLNAEKKYSQQYMFLMIPLLANFLAFLIVIATKSQDVAIPAIGNCLGACLLFAAQISYLYLNGFRPRVKLRHAKLGSFFVDSFFMRLGHNIFNFSIQPIFSNILVALPVGMASSYGYANRISSALVSITLGPASNILTTNVSIACSGKDGAAILRSIKKFILSSIALLFPCVALSYFLIPWALSLLLRGVGVTTIETIRLLFTGLCLWQIILVIEGGFDRVLFAENKSGLFILQNTISIGVILAITSLSKNALGVWSIPLALIVAQIANSVVYITNSLLIIRRMNVGA
jgi:hypothetical protein